MIGPDTGPNATGPGVRTLEPDLALLFTEVDVIMVAAEASMRASFRPRRQVRTRLMPPRTPSASRTPARWLRGRPPPGPRATQRGPPPQ